MATYACTRRNPSSSRGVAMVLALVTAIVLSPLYVNRRNDNRYETRWGSSGLVLPMVLAGLIVAIKSTSSTQREARVLVCSSSNEESSRVLRIGSSSWGLAGVLVMLMFVLSWQNSVQHFFWR